jgi:hypothetical protein
MGRQRPTLAGGRRRKQMNSIYLVAERFFLNKACCYDRKGLCGRPEHVFLNREEAEEYCYHLNRLVRPIRHQDGGWWKGWSCGEASDTITGFCRLERGERDELPDDAWGIFEDPVPEPYWIVEVERKDAEMALEFNQQANPTYRQCHEIIRFFGLDSIFQMLYEKPLHAVGASGYDKMTHTEYYSPDDWIRIKYGSKISEMVQPSFALSRLLSIQDTLPLLENKYVEFHRQVDGGRYYTPYMKPIPMKSFIEETRLLAYDEQEDPEAADYFDSEYLENPSAEYLTDLSDEDYYEQHLQRIHNAEEIN